MIDTNKQNKICKYILRTQGIAYDTYVNDAYLQVCDEDLYNLYDITETISNEYKYTTVEDICKIVDDIRDIITRLNIKRTYDNQIYLYNLRFKDMMQIYEEYRQMNRQREAQVRHGLV